MFKLKSISGLVAASLVAVPAMLSFPIDGWAQIEEIVVTTRRREENLQDVPISVSTLSSAEIERFGIYDLRDVAKYTAGMEFDDGFGRYLQADSAGAKTRTTAPAPVGAQ